MWLSVVLFFLLPSIAPSFRVAREENCSHKSVPVVVGSDTRVYGRDFADDTKENRRSLVSAKFFATRNMSTPPLHLPATSTGMTLEDFFVSRENHKLFFSQDSSNVREVGPPTESQLKRVENQLLLCGCRSDRKTEEMKELDSILVEQIVSPQNFSSLQLSTIVTMWSQILLQSCNNEKTPMRRSRFPFVRPVTAKHSERCLNRCPEYRFVLVDSRLKVNGPRPLVWLFNKLTGAATSGKDKKDSFCDTRPRMMSSFTRVWPELTKDKKVILHSCAQLKVEIYVPSIIRHLIPVTLEQFEKQGSLGLKKALDRDLEPAMGRFEEAYKQWLSLL